MQTATDQRVSWSVIITASLLVAGNLLGVGVLALPIKVGLSGFTVGVIEILIICFIMVISAFVIAARLPAGQKDFDIPSFFHQELGTVGRWIAIICNLILLYGVLIAYLSAISDIVENLFPQHISHTLVTIIYFMLVTSLIMFGRKVLRRGNTILLIVIFISFVVLIKTGVVDFNPHLLSYTNWKYLPLGLPVVVSAFHFHNIIPTVSRYVNYDQKDVRRVIVIGVGIGLLMNLIWVTVVLGTLSVQSGSNSLLHTFLYGLPATIPMTFLLHSKFFSLAGLVFAGLAVTASYVANGTGLFGFIKDMTVHYLKTSNKLVIGALAFLFPLFVTIIYPRIFLAAVDIVGGIGETVLFMILPGIILIRMFRKRNKLFSGFGYAMLFIGLFIFLFILGEKLGLIHLAPTLARYKVHL